MNVMDKRLDILLSCKKAKQKAEEIQSSKSHILIKKMAQQILNRTETIKVLCGAEKYKLYFNGKVAIGKSTAICTLFDLINKNELQQDTRLSNSLLLKTGSGRTTVCETYIYPHSEVTAIKIQKVDNQEFNIYLKEFCKWLNSDESDISEEELRVIKNMSNIPLKLKSPKDILEFLSLTNVDSVFEYLSRSIDYDKRIKLEYEKSPNKAFEEWIKETFENINDGKIKDCPMPYRIYIYINELDFKLKVPKFIDTIIDTRGLDGGERVDIQHYINASDSLSLMCDEINAFGGNESILSILKQVLINENKDTKYRVALVGLEKGKELSNITDCEDNREEGIETKKVQALKKINDNSICFEKENIFFTNTLNGIRIQDNLVNSINFEKQEEERQTFFETIEKMLSRMYTSYYTELCDALKTLDQLEIGKITDSTLDKFKRCKDNTLEIKEKVEKENSKLTSRFKDEILVIYHSSLRGAVNHNGVGRTADVYASFKKCGGEEFIEKCNIHKAELIAIIGQVFKECTEIENICYCSIIEEINYLYSQYYNAMRDNVYNETKKNLDRDSSWSVPKTYWGDGLGSYNQRVCNDIMHEIRTNNIDGTLEKLKLEEKVFTEIAKFLTL